MNTLKHLNLQSSRDSVPRGLWFALTLVLSMTLVVIAPDVRGQDEFNASEFGQSDGLFGGISFGGLGDANQEPVTWSAQYFTSGETGRVEIEAVVGRSWHIYSTTQPPGGPLATKFAIASPGTVSVTGKFTPSDAPVKSVSDIYPGVTIEEHDGVVVWSAPLKVPAGLKTPIKVDVKALVCQSGGSCMPANDTLVATYAGQIKSSDADATPKLTESAIKSAGLAASDADKPTVFRDGKYEVTWTAGVSSSIAPGSEGRIVFSAKPESDYHVYKGVVDATESSTNFVVTKKGGLLVGAPEADKPIISKSLFPAIPGLDPPPPVKYHDGKVTWTLPVQVPESSKPGEYELQGVVCYQACTDKSCLQPMAFEFVATVMVTDTTDQTIQPIDLKTARFASAIDLADQTKWVDKLKPADAAVTESTDNVPPQTTPTDSAADEPQAPTGSDPDNSAPQSIAMPEGGETVEGPEGDQASVAVSPAGSEPQASLPLILLMALGGGLILNLMPCVLPVVGLKIMSFVQQAGEDRKRIFALNFAYVAGIMAVFGGLTLLAVFASFGWGQQFTYFPVRLGLTMAIFALALSYLGVWELPTPGIAAGDTSQDLQDKEGFAGAFFKGAFATILATPCSGPLLGVVLGYTISLRPIETAAVMMTVGLGMSLPYIILGMFPKAISFLPKPGNWMVTLKELLAFLFLGTVAFFFNQFSDADKLPVFVTLIGVWFGCWIIGKVPPWETMTKRLKGWAFGTVCAMGICYFAFTVLAKPPTGQMLASNGTVTVETISDDHLQWEKYNEARLKQLQAEGKTVMLDFTAAWCVNCIVNKEIALDTEATSALLERLDGVAMLADWTDQNQQIKDKLRELDSKSIPVLAIYPGSNPQSPIVLRDLVSQSSVLDALQQAGPSVAETVVASNGSTAEQLTAEQLTSIPSRQLDGTGPELSGQDH